MRSWRYIRTFKFQSLKGLVAEDFEFFPNSGNAYRRTGAFGGLRSHVQGQKKEQLKYWLVQVVEKGLKYEL